MGGRKKACCFSHGSERGEARRGRREERKGQRRRNERCATGGQGGEREREREKKTKNSFRLVCCTSTVQRRSQWWGKKSVVRVAGLTFLLASFANGRMENEKEALETATRALLLGSYSQSLFFFFLLLVSLSFPPLIRRPSYLQKFLFEAFPFAPFSLSVSYRICNHAAST